MGADRTRPASELASRAPADARELLPVVYRELRRLATAHLARLHPGQTLQPTSLVHEAYLKLVGRDNPKWSGKGHFFGAAAQAMREIIVDHLRHHGRQKRGGGRRPGPIGTEGYAVAAEGLGPVDALAVDAALRRLEVGHPRQGRVVVMRYFAGLSTEETAEALGVTPRTVERDWRFARAYLREILDAGELESKA